MICESESRVSSRRSCYYQWLGGLHNNRVSISKAWVPIANPCEKVRKNRDFRTFESLRKSICKSLRDFAKAYETINCESLRNIEKHCETVFANLRESLRKPAKYICESLLNPSISAKANLLKLAKVNAFCTCKSLLKHYLLNLAKGVFIASPTPCSSYCDSKRDCSLITSKIQWTSSQHYFMENT